MAIKKFIQLKDKNNNKLFPISSLEEKGGEIKGNVTVQGNLTDKNNNLISTIEPLYVDPDDIESSKEEWLAGSKYRSILFSINEEISPGIATHVDIVFYFIETVSSTVIKYIGISPETKRCYILQINWDNYNYNISRIPNIKSASVSENTLILTKEDGTTIEFTPQGGGSGGIEVVEEFPEFTEEDESKLYRLIKEDPETGNPIVDNIHMINSEFKPAGDNYSNCNTTKNGTQISSYAAFKGYFDTDLNELYGDDFTISGFTNVYTAYYPNVDGSPVSAIRIGTKNTGSLILSNLQKGTRKLKLIVGKYFSYNGSTGQKTYDENAVLRVESYAFAYEINLEEEATEVEFDLTDGYVDGDDIALYTYGSSAQGRVFIYGFIVEGEARTVLEPEELATKQDVEDLRESLEPRISQNEDDIAGLQDYADSIDEDLQATKEYIGDIQIFNARRLPTPNFDYLNTILRYEGKLYQCVQIGDAQEKEYSFENIAGTSEITGVNWNDFARQVTNGFKDDFELDSWGYIEENWIPATSMKEEVEYRTVNLPDEDVYFFHNTGLNNITITNGYDRLEDTTYSYPFNDIDYLKYDADDNYLAFDDIEDMEHNVYPETSPKPQVYFTCNDPTGFDSDDVGALQYLEEKQIQTIKEYNISKLFRNNGELKMGSSSHSAYFGIIKTDNIDLPITQVKINLKTWSNTKNGQLYWEICNNDSGDGNYDSQYFEASDDVQSVTIEIPEEYNVDFIYLVNEKPEDNGDYRLKIQSIIVQFGSVEYQWKEISGSGGAKVEEVNSLPETGEEGTIYLLPKGAAPVVTVEERLPDKFIIDNIEDSHFIELYDENDNTQNLMSIFNKVITGYSSSNNVIFRFVTSSYNSDLPGYVAAVNNQSQLENVDHWTICMERRVPTRIEPKVVVTDQAEMNIDIQDGEEYLLSSTNETSTKFNLPAECYLVGDINYLNGLTIINGISSHDNNSTYVDVVKDKEVYIKRIGNMILISTTYSI